MRLKNIVLFILVIFIIFGRLNTAWGTTVTLAWDPSTGATGYNVFYGTSPGNYTFSKDSGGGDTQHVFTNMQSNTTYYFAVTAYDGTNESVKSKELMYTTPIGVIPNPDADGDGVPNLEDAFPNNPLEWKDNDNDGVGDNSDTDDDNDGMPDIWEISHNLNPLFDDSLEDPDGDGLKNLEEFNTGNDPNQTNQNIAPGAPVGLSPSDEFTEATTKLSSGDFFDDDFRDTHSASEWRIVRQDNNLTVFTQKSINSLRSIIVPSLILDQKFSYYWQVRYFDNHNKPSAWSKALYFTTKETGRDLNFNGIIDKQEVDITVDLNKNLIPDANESKIMSIITESGVELIGVSPEDTIGANILSVISENADSSILKNNIPDTLPLGIISLKLNVPDDNDNSMLTIYFLNSLPENTKVYLYNNTESWIYYSNMVDFSPDYSNMSFVVTDGGPDDLDGTKNGFIVLSLAISHTLPNPNTTESPSQTYDSGGGGGGGGGCFIQIAEATGGNLLYTSLHYIFILFLAFYLQKFIFIKKNL